MKFFGRSATDSEIDDELRAHILHRADDLERSGIDRAEAERRARIEFGGQMKIREQCQDASGGVSLESLARDIRYTVRVLRKAPGFTLVAIATLALAIGANTVVFAALNAVILRPLDVPRAGSLYSIHRVTDSSAGVSYPDYLDVRDRNRSFEDLAAYNFMLAGIESSDTPSRAWLVAASGNYFDVLGIQPYLGRFFHASDERGDNSAPFAVLSYAYWHGHFQEDPAVVGRVVRLNKHQFTIIGVAPRGFHGTLLFGAPDLFVPMVNQEQIEGTNVLHARAKRWIFMSMGHLKAGVTAAQAADDVNAISALLEKEYPNDHRHMKLTLSRPSLYGDYMGRPVRAFLTALMLLAGLILLAACANLGSLFAARAADRSREIALRLALGAGRVRVLRQLFTESLLISIAGGAIGLWGSILLLQSVASWRPFPEYPINLPVTPDATVYAVSVALAVASGLLFGAVPVRQILRTDPYAIVKSGARATADRRISARDVLVVAQIAICAVLVTSSIVAVRGLVRSLHSDFGFEPRGAILADTDLAMAGYRGGAVAVMQKRMIDAMETIPGASGVGLVDTAPLSQGGAALISVFTEDTVDLKPGNAITTAMTFSISPGYFQAARTSLLEGRNITLHDDEGAPRVAVVNREFARRIFGAPANALGRHFKLRDGARLEIAGIVEDGKYVHLTEAPAAAMFVPLLQSPSSETTLVVRSATDSPQLASAIQGKLRELDPGLPALIQTWDEGLNLVLFPSRVATVSLGLLGVMGAMLSMTGIFGMAAYSVSRRMRELGIRIALGASRKEVLRAALGRALKSLALGSVAGVAFGLLATRVLAFIVYEATPRDPLVLVAVVSVMCLLGLLATWIPAQRALSIDPLMLLKEE